MRPKHARSCTYVVAIDPSATDHDLQDFASYLSTLHAANCEFVVLDPAPAAALEERRRILRWVARHVGVGGRQLLPSGEVDVLQAAVDLALCEKIIVASPDCRYTAAEIAALLSLLDRNEAVEPEEFVQPMPWWSGVDAGRMLLQRGLDQPHRAGRTFAFRKTAWHPLRGFEERHRDNHLRRLAVLGADVRPAREVFVRRQPPSLGAWVRSRLREAAAESAVPFHTAAFAGIIPLLTVLLLIGGAELAGGYAGMIALGSVLIAIRGRSGASRFFPLHAPLFAPLWIVERSVSVYWAWFARLRAARRDVGDEPVAVERRLPAPRGEGGPPGRMRG